MPLQKTQTYQTTNTLNMAELTANNPTLHKYYLMHPTLIDVSHIEDESEVETLRNIILYKVDNTQASCSGFQKSFVQPFAYAIAHYDNSGLVPYFVKKYSSMNICYRKASTIALRYIKEKNINDQILHNHVIYLKNVSIAPERMSTGKVKTINFRKIKDSLNQALAEKWVISLLMETDLAISTITNRLHCLTKILNKYDINCRLWTDNDVRTCYKDILAEPYDYTRKITMLSTIKNFFIYLADNKYILSSSAWLLFNQAGIKTVQHYKQTAPSEYIISQIFNVLEEATDFVRLAFLILYCTGMRVSELQSLKKDCLDIRENAVFIKYYQPKMRKEVSNIIPPILAEMIKDYKENHFENEIYLFENFSGKKMTTGTITRRINIFFTEQGIKNEDGTPYHFRSHSMRHLMAVRMHRYKIPYRYIQEQLHHDHPAMTLFYIEHVDSERIKKMSKWINSKGQKITPEHLKFDIQRAQIESAILPNGLCNRPAMLPSCQHCNTCFECQFFTTSKEWLPVLINQKKRLEEFIASSEAKGWDRAVTNSQRTLNELNYIIKKLEVH